MSRHQKKSFLKHIKWWWQTRVIGLFRIRLKKAVSKDISQKSTPIGFHKKASELGQVKPSGITAILTAYRRIEYLEDQIISLRNQTIPPDEIWVWFNSSEDQQIDVSTLVDRVIVSNTNWLFWGRFAMGNMARTGYVAFFDDDILPQPRWFENCLKTIEDGYDGILGGSGVILPLEGGYSSKQKAGWNGQQLEQVATVDLVGHAWFMKKDHLKYMWYEEPHSWDNGEDIHLSYMALKHGNIKTFVPPHPENNQSQWSCRPDFGKIVGRKKVATFKTKVHKNIRSEIVDAYRQDGWQITQITSPDRIKTFAGDLTLLNLKLTNKDNFSLVRFGDGEMIVINGESIDLSQKCNGEHKYSPGNKNDEKHREILGHSLTYQDPQYYVGLPCRCCVGDKHCEQLKEQSQQSESSLTWANIFVNSNYPLFLDKTVSALSARTVNIICHEKADLNHLPMKIKKDFRVGANAWSQDYNKTVESIAQYIEENSIQDEVFIFCAGVISNMLIYELTKRNKNNTHIDLGSVFDDVMNLGKTRKYLKGSKKRLNQVCVW